MFKISQKSSREGTFPQVKREWSPVRMPLSGTHYLQTDLVDFSRSRVRNSSLLHTSHLQPVTLLHFGMEEATKRNLRIVLLFLALLTLAPLGLTLVMNPSILSWVRDSKNPCTDISSKFNASHEGLSESDNGNMTVVDSLSDFDALTNGLVTDKTQDNPKGHTASDGVTQVGEIPVAYRPQFDNTIVIGISWLDPHNHCKPVDHLDPRINPIEAGYLPQTYHLASLSTDLNVINVLSPDRNTSLESFKLQKPFYGSAPARLTGAVVFWLASQNPDHLKVDDANKAWWKMMAEITLPTSIKTKEDYTKQYIQKNSASTVNDIRQAEVIRALVTASKNDGVLAPKKALAVIKEVDPVWYDTLGLLGVTPKSLEKAETLLQEELGRQEPESIGELINTLQKHPAAMQHILTTLAPRLPSTVGQQAFLNVPKLAKASEIYIQRQKEEFDRKNKWWKRK